MKLSLRFGPGIRVALGLTLLSGIPAIAQSQWTQQNPQVPGAIHAVAMTNGLYVAVGAWGVGFTSSDGIDWAVHAKGIPSGVRGMAASDSLFVAVSAQDHISAVHTSRDGVVWKASSSPVVSEERRLYAIAWSGDLFVAVGNGVIVTSPDGDVWTERMFEGRILMAVTWAGTQFVAVGSVGTILTSPDGVTWTTRPSGISELLGGVAWTGDQIVVAARDTVLTSPDGISWSKRPTGESKSVVSMTWSGSRLIGVSGYSTADVLTSTDGMTWVGHDLAGEIHSTVRVGDRVIAAGSSGDLFISDDGVSWVKGTLDFPLLTPTLRAVAWTGSRIVAVGDGVLTSASGAAFSWDLQSSPTVQGLRAVVWGVDRLVAVGEAGTILTSPDGLAWTVRTAPPTQTGSVQTGTDKTLNAVIWGGGQFVAVGEAGVVLTSPDGSLWTAHAAGVSTTLYAVQHADDQYIAVGDEGALLASPDGVTWSKRVSGVERSLTALAWKDGVWVVSEAETRSLFGSPASMLTSSDGIAWTRDPMPWVEPLNAIISYGNRFFGVGGSDTMVTSQGGTDWTPYRLPPGVSSLAGIVMADNRLIAVGEAGVVLTAPVDSVTGVVARRPTRATSLFRHTASRLYVTLPASLAEGPVRWTIVSVAGRKLVSGFVQEPRGELVLPVNRLGPGVYSFHVESGRIRIAERFRILP